MLRFRLALRWLVDLPVAGAPILLEGNGALVTEDHIMKSVATFHNTPSELQSFHLVRVSYELTISGPL